jgi:hypothetical protein
VQLSARKRRHALVVTDDHQHVATERILVPMVEYKQTAHTTSGEVVDMWTSLTTQYFSSFSSYLVISSSDKWR